MCTVYGSMVKKIFNFSDLSEQSAFQNKLDCCKFQNKMVIEIEKEGVLPFVDVSLCKKKKKTCIISAGTYSKASQTLKYSTFSSKRPCPQFI